jgi:hypothetical protein
MSITSRRFARYIALPAVSAGIIGGAALGLAGAANAATNTLRPSPTTPGRASPFELSGPRVHRLGDTKFHRFNR